MRDEGETVHIEGISPAHAMLFQRLAEATSEETCKRLLMMMGVPSDDPIAAQTLFADLRRLGKLDKRVASLEKWRWVHALPMAAIVLYLGKKLGLPIGGG